MTDLVRGELLFDSVQSLRLFVSSSISVSISLSVSVADVAAVVVVVVVGEVVISFCLLSAMCMRFVVVIVVGNIVVLVVDIVVKGSIVMCTTLICACEWYKCTKYKHERKIKRFSVCLLFLLFGS